MLAQEEIDEHLKSAREFVDLMLGDDNVLSPQHRFDVFGAPISNYIYRGQANKDWSLIPSAHRSFDSLIKFCHQAPSFDFLEAHGRLRFIQFHVHSEIRSVRLFLESADRVGIPTPLDYNDMELCGKILDVIAKEDGSGISDIFPDPSFHRAMSMAQHHGVPTRLLDWTHSPFVAAFFAAEGAINEVKEGRSIDYFSIYCLSRTFLNDVDGVSLISSPMAENSYLRSQSGLFTVATKANKFFFDNGRWPSLEEVINSGRKIGVYYQKYPFFKISLPVKEAIPLLRLLYRMGISRLTLMPSLDNAAKDYSRYSELWG